MCFGVILWVDPENSTRDGSQVLTMFKLLTEHHLEFLSFKEPAQVSSESTRFKIQHCFKPCVTVHSPT